MINYEPNILSCATHFFLLIRLKSVPKYKKCPGILTDCIIVYIIAYTTEVNMAQNTEQKYKSITPQQIAQLNAIYNDYLYIVRRHEGLFNAGDISAHLATEQIISHSPDNAHYSWEYGPASINDKQRFEDAVNNDIYPQGNAVYIILHHVKKQENCGYSKYFAIPPYALTDVNMQIPSGIERCSIIYPTNGTLENVEFYVDGKYKIVYNSNDAKNILIRDAIQDYDILSSLCGIINVTKAFCKNKYVMDDKFRKSAEQIYATERLSRNENVILELIGSFAEKILAICREIYGDKLTTYRALKCAEQDGFIQSADDFRDYINLRHFMRHQWDGLDYYGTFDSGQAAEHEKYRNNYINSYLKLCDNTLVQRKKNYINILHQMQFVMQNINPNLMIRDQFESNNKFFKRVKSFVMQTPGQNITAELNYQITDEKYKKLINNFYKFLPVVDIQEEFEHSPNMQTKIDSYNMRSWFLNTFNSADCMVMRYCLMRGRNLVRNAAWDYIRDTGIITPAEYDLWYNYTDLRKALSHNYFDDALRQQLHDCADKYEQDLQILNQKILSIDIRARKVSPGVCEYLGPDGLLVRLDYNNHCVADVKKITIDCDGKTVVVPQPQKPSKPEKEVCPNGVEFNMSGNEIINVKLPNGIIINLNTQSIDWDIKTHWNTDNEYFNTLQTDKSKIITDKDLRVTEYTERNRPRPYRAGDSWFLDGRHHIQLDAGCRIKELKFKNFRNKVIQTAFIHKKDGQNLLIFPDGTTVTQFGKQITVTHADKTLTFDNRQDFAATYIEPEMILQQSAQNNNVR